MRFVAVTACPTGVAHTLMAAEALKRQAEVMGHDIDVETQGSVGVEQTLTADQIAAADAVIVAADIHVDMARFAGKPMHAVSTSEAIRHTDTVIADTVPRGRRDGRRGRAGDRAPHGAPDAGEPEARRASRPARPASPTPSWPRLGCSPRRRTRATR